MLNSTYYQFFMLPSVQSHIQDFRNKEVHTVYYVITFLSDFATSTISAIYVLFLLSKGLNLLQVNLVNLAFMIGNFLFEIPTGAYADYFGRKKSVLLSNIFLTIGFATYFFASSFPMFIIAETISALAFTFESGALDAWLVDHFEQKSYIGKVDFVFSHANVISQIAGLLGGLVGAYVGSKSLRLPMGVGALIALLTTFVTYFFMHEQIAPKTELKLKESMKQLTTTAKEGMMYVIRHEVIFGLTFIYIFLTFAFQSINMFWSPRLYALAGNHVVVVGWIWVGVSLFMMLGGLLIRNVLHHMQNYTGLFIATLLILAIPMLIASISQSFYLVLTGFLTYEIGRGMFSPLQKSSLNKYIQGNVRATVLSFNSMMGKVGAGAGLVVMGIIAQHRSIQLSWILAIILILAMIPVSINIFKNREIQYATN